MTTSKVFKYLNNAEAKSADVLLKNHTWKDIYTAEGCILRSEGLNCAATYHLMSKKEVSDILGAKIDGNYHEVICGDHPQKLRFDIDVDLEVLAGIEADPMFKYFTKARAKFCKNVVVETLLQHIISATGSVMSIRDIFDLTYTVFSSCGSDINDAKYSFHIHNDIALPTHKHVAEIADEIYDVIQEDMFEELAPENITEDETNDLKKYIKAVCAFIDRQVYKSTQNFRLVFNTKAGSSRVKTPIFGIKKDHSDYLIGNVAGCKMLDFELKKNDMIAGITSIPEEYVVKAVAMLSKAATGHKFARVRGNCLIYRRLAPSHCEFCGRAHEADNSFYGLMHQSETALSVYYGCRRFDGEIKTKLCGEIPIDVPNAKSAKDTTHITRYDFISEYIKTAVVAKPPKLPNVETYSDTKMRPYPLDKPIICVKAPMKLGKTKQLIVMLDDLQKLTPRPIRVAILSFRQTFSKEVKANFPDFIVYNEVEGLLTQDKIIVQIESLHRIYTKRAKFDVVILDESESIIEQFNSGLLKNFAGSFAVFEWMLKYSAKIVCMDANLGDRTLNILAKMAPSPIHYIHNQCKNASNDTIYILANSRVNAAKWAYLLIDKILAGKRVVITTNAFAFGRQIQKLILNYWGDRKLLRIHLYSAETHQSEKTLHFSDVGKFWSQYDVLIYTPTITAGISFEKLHYDCLFSYMTAHSCNAETSVQMMGRVRNFSEKTSYILVDYNVEAYPTTRQEIKKWFFKSRGHITPTQPNYQLNELGEVDYIENNYFHIWLENTLTANRSKANYAKTLINILKEAGPTMISLTDKVFEKLTNINLADEPTTPEHKMFEGLIEALVVERKKDKEQITTEIAAAENIDDETASNIREAMATEKNVSVAERRQYDKFRIAKIYNMPKPAITGLFVKNYSSRRMINAYKNSEQLLRNSNLDAAISEIKADEEKNYGMFIMKSSQREINHIYMYGVHKSAVDILRLCGFRAEWTRQRLTASVIVANCTTGCKKICTELNNMLAISFNPQLPLKKISAMIAKPEITIKTMSMVFAKIYDAHFKEDRTKKFVDFLPSANFNYVDGDTSTIQSAKPTIYIGGRATNYEENDVEHTQLGILNKTPQAPRAPTEEQLFQELSGMVPLHSVPLHSVPLHSVPLHSVPPEAPTDETKQVKHVEHVEHIEHVELLDDFETYTDIAPPLITAPNPIPNMDSVVNVSEASEPYEQLIDDF